MTEQEYINVQELVIVGNAKELLSHIVVVNSSVISPDDYAKVLNQLHEWETRLNEKIKIKHQ